MAQAQADPVPAQRKRGRPLSLSAQVADETLEATALLRQAARQQISATQKTAEACRLLQEAQGHQVQAVDFTAKAFRAQRNVNRLAESLSKAR